MGDEAKRLINDFHEIGLPNRWYLIAERREKERRWLDKERRRLEDEIMQLDEEETIILEEEELLSLEEEEFMQQLKEGEEEVTAKLMMEEEEKVITPQEEQLNEKSQSIRSQEYQEYQKSGEVTRGPFPTQSRPEPSTNNIPTAAVPYPSKQECSPSRGQAGPSPTRVDRQVFSYNQADPFSSQSGLFSAQTGPLVIETSPLATQTGAIITQSGPPHTRASPCPTQIGPFLTQQPGSRIEESPIKFQCKHCKKVFSGTYCLNRHIITTHEKNTTLLECEHCGSRFKRRDNLEVHLKFKHSDSKPGPFVCPKCGREYSRNTSLWRHLKYECGVPPQFCCSQCPYKMCHKSNLKSHMLKKHGSENK